MKIGFDVSQTGRSKAGCGYFANSLVETLSRQDHQNEYVLMPTVGDFFWDPEWSTTTFRSARKGFSVGPTQSSREAADHFWNAEAEVDFDRAVGNLDVFHANNFFCPIRFRSTILVYTLYDLSFLENPDWTTEGNRVGCFNGVFNASVYADFILAISEFSRRHFLRIFPHFPADRIVVMYPASKLLTAESTSVDTAAPGDLIPGRFWLSVGTIEPRKNLGRLLEAYAAYRRQSGEPLPLAIAGGRGWLMESFENQIRDLGLHDAIVQLGYVDDAQLRWLYENTFGLIYPSLFEGFGLPIVEAMGMGAPVIASNSTSIPEIVGTCGILIDPYSVDSITAAMLRLETEPTLRSTLVNGGPKQTARFSWSESANRMVSHYQQAVSLGKRYR